MLMCVRIYSSSFSLSFSLSTFILLFIFSAGISFTFFPGLGAYAYKHPTSTKAFSKSQRKYSKTALRKRISKKIELQKVCEWNMFDQPIKQPKQKDGFFNIYTRTMCSTTTLFRQLLWRKNSLFEGRR